MTEDAIARAVEALEHLDRASKDDLQRWNFPGILSALREDRELASRWAGRASAIELRTFRQQCGLTVPIPLGNLLLMVVVYAGIRALVATFSVPHGVFQSLLLTLGCLLVVGGVGPLARFLVGRRAGLAFLFHYPGGLLRVQPRLKGDYESYLRVAPIRRALAAFAAPAACVLALIAIGLLAWKSHLAWWNLLILGVLAGVSLWTEKERS